jgi:hypothetical protein
MKDGFEISRRDFFLRAGTVGAAFALSGKIIFPGLDPRGEDRIVDIEKLLAGISDPEIRAGVEAAILKNILPAAVETAYPGYFWITADGKAFGDDATWPGLDSWQMAGAYLLLGHLRLVQDYFDFVKSSQKKDGDIPFAIFPAEPKPDTSTFLRGLHYPEDIFTFTPWAREGRPASRPYPARKWIGLFDHWVPKANPLSALGPVSYILTAGEIAIAGDQTDWLKRMLPSIERAADYLLGLKSANGLISGSGFYMENPPRFGWDGVTQCYVVHAFRDLARLFRSAGDPAKAEAWSGHADRLAEAFTSAFWRDDHFAEYIHAERGLVDSHGLSDVNWAAVAFGVAADRHLSALWPRLMKERAFWQGDMPTQTVTKPFSYETWEQGGPVPFSDMSRLYDVAAMGRVWFLEATACLRMKEYGRLVDSVRKVCRAGLATGGFWYERYHPRADGTIIPRGPKGYCEYPAILTRIVLGNPGLFSSTAVSP